MEEQISSSSCFAVKQTDHSIRILHLNYIRLRSFVTFLTELDNFSEEYGIKTAEHIQQYLNNSDVFLCEAKEVSFQKDLLFHKYLFDKLVFSSGEKASIDAFAEWTSAASKEFLFLLQTKNNVHLPIFLGLTPGSYVISADDNLSNFKVTYKHQKKDDYFEKLGIKKEKEILN